MPKTFGLSLDRVFRLSTRYANDEKERRVLRTGSIEFDPHRLHRLCLLLAGNSSLFLRHLNLQNFVEFCARAEVTAVHMGGYKLGALVRSGTQTGRLPSFTTIHTGGARVPGTLRKRLKCVLTDNLYVIYATSEIGLISCATPDQHESFPEGVGFPATSLTLEIIGPDGGQVAPGEIGQIRVRKVGMFNDYVTAQGANANFREGWFYPRDLVSLMPGEPLIFHGRADDVMILNGINIFPSAIEDILESHPGVKEAVAYAVKSRVHGEIPVAAVVLNDAAEAGLASDLLNHCRQALGIRAHAKSLCSIAYRGTQRASRCGASFPALSKSGSAPVTSLFRGLVMFRPHPKLTGFVRLVAQRPWGNWIMRKVDAIDFAKLLGFDTVTRELSETLDLQDETLGAKLGAKIGDAVEAVAPEGR